MLSGGFTDVRAAVVAFGDEPLRQVSARDLAAGQYKLWPEERHFQACSPASLTDLLASVPPSPGADFVDALADAVDACVSLNWREHARKLVVVTGDSPGYSLVRPPQWELQLDAHVRERDVDSAALRLFETWGAEVVTIYHDVPGESGLLQDPRIREATAFARAQYGRLASRPGLGVRRSTLAPDALAGALLTTSCFGMGVSMPAAVGS